MSTICLQFGQCGNQIGAQFLNAVSEDLIATQSRYSPSPFFNITNKENLVANSILVDAEPKVIEQVFTESAAYKWSYNRKNIIYAHEGGSANNWSTGYSFGSDILESLCNQIQTLTEELDSFRGLMSLFSLAGGTGSGLGSFMNTHLKDEFPRKTLLNTVVLPNSHGETTVQNYNVLLSASKFVGHPDAVLVFSNDYLNKLCSRIHKRKIYSLKQVNKILAEQLSCLMIPWASSNVVADLIPLLACDPYAKLINVKNSPAVPEDPSLFGPELTWEQIINHVRLMQTMSVDYYWDCKPTTEVPFGVRQRRNFQYRRSLGSLVVTRGPINAEENDYVNSVLNKDLMFPPWVPSDKRFLHFHHPKSVRGIKKSCLIAANNSTHIDTIQKCISRAWKSYSNDAYLHHFLVNGLTKGSFLEAFARVDELIACYNAL